MVFTVTLSGTGSASTVAEPVTLRYATADGTATADADYNGCRRGGSGRGGNMQAQFTVGTLQDDQAEPDETFTVTLSGGSERAVAGRRNAGDDAGHRQPIDDDDQLMVDLTGPQTRAGGRSGELHGDAVAAALGGGNRELRDGRRQRYGRH